MGASFGQIATADPTAAPSVSDIARFNGSYYGAFEVKMAPHHGCGAGHDHVMVIKNGRVTMSYSATKSFEGEIGPSGAISQDIVTGETWNSDCAYRFSLKRRS
jgi:hypothetical protein